MMYRILHIAKYFTLVIALLALSCVKEELVRMPDTPTEVSGDRVRLRMYTDAGEFVNPVTRAANETAVGQTPWVVVFTGTNDNAIFSEARQSVVSGGQTYVDLLSTAATSRVLVIANAPAKFRNSAGTEYPFDETTLNNVMTGKTVTQVVNDLLVSPLLESPQTTIPYDGQSLPMSAFVPVTFAGINTNTVINNTGTSAGTALSLKRIVAKVTVDASAAVSTFTLLGVTVVDAPRNGGLAQAGTTIIGNTGNLTDYMYGSDVIASATDNTTLGNPLYLFESKETTTTVIVKGIYNGTTGYYKLAFMNGGTRLDVMRNMYYAFTISAVNGTGYATLAEAKANTASNSVAVTLQVTDQSAYNIVDNGQYYLAVSNTELWVYDDTSTGLVAVTLTHNAPSTVSTGKITVSGDGFSLTTPGQTIPVTGGVVSTSVAINIASTASKGTLTLQVGNLTKTINLSLAGKINPANTMLPLLTTYMDVTITEGTDWLSVAEVNDPSLGRSWAVSSKNGPGDFYVFVTTNTSLTTDRTGVIYGSRTLERRLKIILTQSHS